MVLGYKFLSVQITGRFYNIYNVFLIANNIFLHSTLQLMVMVDLLVRSHYK